MDTHARLALRAIEGRLSSLGSRPPEAPGLALSAIEGRLSSLGSRPPEAPRLALRAIEGRLPSLGSRPTAVALPVMVALAHLLTGCGPQTAAIAQSAAYEGTPLEGQAADFRLTDQDGAEVRLSDFRGEVVALTFMDSQCQEVCPLTSLHLRSAHQRLDPAEAGSVVFLAVNVNAEAIGVEQVVEAMGKWRLDEIAGFRFLTGSEPELRPVWEAYNITVYPAPEQDGELVHTPGVYLIDRQGQLRWYVSTPFDEAGVAQWTASLSDLLVKHLRTLLQDG